jgi:hypothetical protein
MQLAEKIMRWDSYEAEGAAAALASKTHDDCPYEDRSSEAWSFWIWGFDQVAGELATIERGEVFITDSGPPGKDFTKPGTGIPLREAYESGLWTPRYASVPAGWKRRHQWLSA